MEHNDIQLVTKSGTHIEKSVKADLALVQKLLPVLSNVVRQHDLEIAADLIDCASFAVGEKLASLNVTID